MKEDVEGEEENRGKVSMALVWDIGENGSEVGYSTAAKLYDLR